jgi:hypothetical protein
MPRPAISCFLLVCGCGAVPVVQPPPPTELPDVPAAAEFPGAAALLSGFDAATDSGAWETGDRLLFGLRLRKRGEEHRWLMQLEVEFGQAPMRVTATPADGGDPVRFDELQIDLPRGSWSWTIDINGRKHEHVLTSALCPVKVRVFDAGGGELGHSSIHLPADLLARGMLEAVDVEKAAARERTAGSAPPDPESLVARVLRSVEAIIAAMSLLNVVQEDDLLADYFWQVVEKPSLWSVVTSLGVKATLSMPFEDSAEAASLPPSLPPQPRAAVIPLRIDVNGSPALFADVLATDPRRPLSLCGGMVAASAHHPTDSSVHFDVVLLAARLAQRR